MSSPSPSSIPSVRHILAAAALVLGVFLHLIATTFAQSDAPRVRILDIDGTITPAMAQYVDRGIRTAEDDGFTAVILRIDTPGGLSSAMDDIIDSELRSDVPVIAWVGPNGARAASAGVFITYAAHITVMAPGTRIGSASPVSSDGSEMTETMRNKVTNDAVAQIRNLAELRGRNADWAEGAVRNADNITASEALQLGVVSALAPDIPSLLNGLTRTAVTLDDGTTVTLDMTNATTSTESMSLIERFLQVISDPTIAYLLLSFGALGLFLELAQPGGFVPGTIGVICLVLGLYSLGSLPVNWTGVILIGLAFAFFLVDIYVASFGLLLIAGMSCFIIGSYLLVDTSVPGYNGVSRPVIWTSAACILGLSLVIGMAALRILGKRPATGVPALIGKVGVVRRPLGPDGMVFLDGELWSASFSDMPAEAEPVPVGRHVEVVSVQGLRLDVKPTTRTIGKSGPQGGRGDGVIPVPYGARSV